MYATNTTGTVSGAWATANDPVSVPFVINNAGVVEQLCWFNGTSAGGGVDVGIYDEAWNLIIACGTNTGSGNTTWQSINVTDTALALGRYHLVMVRDNTTANRCRFYNIVASNSLLQFAGLNSTTTDSYPLPNPLSGMAAVATATQIPVMGIQFRAFV